MPLSTEVADEAPPPADTTNRKNMFLLIQLRWIAAIGQIVTIAVAELVLGIVLPLGQMAVVLGALVALNLVSIVWLRNRTDVSNRALLLAMMFDVGALTVQLYLSGGATNPFTALYLLQITLGAVLLDAWSTWAIVAIAFGSFIGLTQFNQPLVLTRSQFGDLFSLHLAGMVVCFALDAALLVVFVTRITRNLRSRDARLAAFKQQAAEEDHIVRMGLLASGAAHELGTPLASVAVILSDWRRMPEIRLNSEMSEDIEEMQAAVQRCKSIVTGILMSAGEARGDAPAPTTVNDFLTDIVNGWRAGRPSATLHYVNAFGSNLPIVSDSILKQIVFNLLDNAYEASPQWIELTAEHVGDTLLIRVSDAGPGFAPDMLTHVGKPYRSTKGRLGGGLGLFLVVNVVRKLGGSVSATNRPEGGAVVTLTLPLHALQITGVRGHV
jgi:two-component system sensor histidine kinase RegB